MNYKTKMQLSIKIIFIFLICAADILWGAFFIYHWKENGTVISVKNASENLQIIFTQNIIVSLIPIFSLIVSYIVLKRNFAKEMYMKIDNKMQRKAIIILFVILFFITAIGLATKSDKITIIYNLLYYTMFIAFTEEFVVRDVCVYFLRKENKYIRYLVPNVMFAIMHIFSYAQWGNITITVIISFISSQMIGLIVMGVLFQYIKEKSGSIWIAVLVHAILDYSVILSY